MDGVFVFLCIVVYLTPNEMFVLDQSVVHMFASVKTKEDKICECLDGPNIYYTRTH